MDGILDARRALCGFLLIGLVCSTPALAQEPTAEEIDTLAKRAMEAFQTPGIAIGVVED